MDRKHFEILGALVLAAGGAAVPGLSACTVDNTTYLTIAAARPLGEGCGFPDEGLFHSEGLWDAAAARGTFGYVTYLEITNHLPCNSDDCTDGETEGRLDSNQVLLTELTITYDREGPLTFLPEDATEKKAIMIGAEGSEIEPTVLMLASLIDGAIADDFLSGAIANAGDSIEVLVTVQAKGVLLDDSEVESNEFTFPVTVCNGCLAASLPADCVPCSPAQPDGLQCVGGGGS